MPRYLFMATYTSEGVEAVVEHGGTARRAAVERMLASLGGRLITFDFAFGDTDVYIVAELPDNTAAAAAALTVNSDGRMRVRTVPLLSPEEIDAAGSRQVTFEAPGTIAGG